MKKACVIGGGTWGSAFALHLGRLGIATNLWIREEDIFETAQNTKENQVFLPGFQFPENVSFFMDLRRAVQSSDVVFIAVPSTFCRKIYENLSIYLRPESILVSLTKGIEENSLKRMSEVMEEIFSQSFVPKVGVLSGPSFAREVAERHPTAVVLASRDQNLARTVQHFISCSYFRTYTSQDVIGVEIAGALKNVIAIAAGISTSLQFGSNTVAALVTRGIAEISRLGLTLGAKAETFSGLAGIGDLVLTCTGQLSRNRHVGNELGKGKSLDEVIKGMQMIAEGIPTTQSAFQLSRRERVEMPICEQVYKVLYENKDPREALHDLMSRELKDEHKEI